jgi:N6-adenosine-specific RNA methylase IME4
VEQALTVSQKPAGALAILEDGDRAIAATKTVPEIKEMRAQLDGAEEYLKKTGRYDLGMMQRLAELRVRAEQKLGDLLARIEKNKGGQPKKNRLTRETGTSLTLAEMGIKKKTSHLAQKMAALPADKVGEVFKEARDLGRPVTLADVLAKAKPYAAKASNAAKHKDIADKARVITTDIGGPFPLIYADPPWTFETYSWKGQDRTPAKHYPTMTDDDIKSFVVADSKIPDLAHKDAALFLWCTSSNLVRALSIMEEWGFTYKTQAVWDKQKSGTGQIFLNQHEILLYGSRGKIPKPAKIFPSVFSYPRGKHSVKPAEVRAALESMYPHFDKANRIELFARENVAGWTVDGYEST